MSKKRIAKRMLAVGLKIGKYAKNEIEKEVKSLAKSKNYDTATAKRVGKKMLSETKKYGACMKKIMTAEMKKAMKKAKRKAKPKKAKKRKKKKK